MVVWIAYVLLVLVIGILALDHWLMRKRQEKSFEQDILHHVRSAGVDEEARRCYAWEEAVIIPKLRDLGYHTDMPAAEAKEFVKKICDDFGFEVPRLLVSQFNGVLATGISIDGHTIMIRETTDELVLLHELAHIFLHQLGYETEAHGRLFVHTYIDLLEHVGVTGVRQTVHAWAVDTMPNAPITSLRNLPHAQS